MNAYVLFVPHILQQVRLNKGEYKRVYILTLI